MKDLKFDVVVVGAGPAGFSASISASRQGKKVALIEKENMAGGILTVGGNNCIDQFNNPFRKDKKIIIKGIAWELVKKLKENNFAIVPDMYAERYCHNQYTVKVNPVATAHIMDEMLLNANVNLFFGQPLVDVEKKGNKIISAIIATKNGLQKISGKIFIDCTGDGDLAFLSKANFLLGGNDGSIQPGTLRIYPACNPNKDDKILNFGDNENHFAFNPTDSNSITKSNILARESVYNDMLKGKKVMCIANSIAPREGRRIKGLTEMNYQDYLNGVVFSDSVCYTYWLIDIHRENAPSILKYVESENTPTVRLSSMISADIDNLMMAGRNISTDRETNSAIRVKASCMAMGEAVGIASAIFVEDNVKQAKKIDAKKVKQKLNRVGAIVPSYSIGEDF